METDPDDDVCRNYKVPFPRGPALRISHQSDGTFKCPVCPGLAHWWTRPNKVRVHVLGLANSSALRSVNKKKYSCHRILARNEGWMH